ncbi:hypothetical protein [Pradoshia sp.]
MNKYQVFSLAMVGLSIVLASFITSDNAGLLWVGFSVFSIVGIIFACLSKKWVFIILGIFLNSAVWMFFSLLVLGMGIGER